MPVFGSLLRELVVQDLAARFADGRLSTEKLLEADDEELFEMLTAVRGIGPVSSTIAGSCDWIRSVTLRF